MPAAKSVISAQTTLNAANSTIGKQSADLDAPGVGTVVAKRVLSDIDEYCATTYDDGHRKHLGGSLIGEPCKRKLWYQFRWTYREKHDGRQQRLFNRGHREEDRFVEWLEGIGAKVWFEDRETNPLYYCAEDNTYHLQSNLAGMHEKLAVKLDSNDSGYLTHVKRAKADGIDFPQYRVSHAHGHFGGSLDGIAILPERYGIPGPILLEFKTNGTGPKFTELLTQRVAIAKPMHFAQMSTYGSDPQYLFKHALYMNICKNDDNLHVEIVKLDWNLGDQMRQKAVQIITSQEPPPRLSDNPTYKDCKYCAAQDLCHKGAIPEKNCRSCAHAHPVENKRWFCDKHNGLIPDDYIKGGCDGHYPITAQARKMFEIKAI